MTPGFARPLDEGVLLRTRRLHPRDGSSLHSTLSFCFAASFVCHRMFDGVSAPPRFSGLTWSMT